MSRIFIRNFCMHQQNSVMSQFRRPRREKATCRIFLAMSLSKSPTQQP